MRALGNVIKQEGQYNRVYGPLMIVAYDWVWSYYRWLKK
jgi:hypothetical protein